MTANCNVPGLKPECCRKMCERYPCFLLNASMVTWDALMQDVCHIYESSEWPHLRTLTYFRFCLLATEKLLFGWRESQEKQRPEVCLFSQAINYLAFHNKWISRAPVPLPVGSWTGTIFVWRGEMTFWYCFQVAFSYTYELRPYLDLLLQMLLITDSWQNHRIHNTLKGKNVWEL